MRYSQLLSKTLREDPKEAEFISHKLLLKAGFINQLSSGVYSYLPLGLRTLENISNIIRKELEAINCHEILMPALAPKTLWEHTDRWNTVDVLMKIQDKHGAEFVLSPTHEETITDLAAQYITSYKDLPLSTFQIQTKFRDETRLKGGLTRGKEFIMKDAYSFHANTESLDETFDTFKDTYHRIFKKAGLEVMDVNADAGSIGGTGSKEFMAVLPSGEDTIVICNECGYHSNTEAAVALISDHIDQEGAEKTLIDTPDATSIDEVCTQQGIQALQTIKAIVYKADDNYILALIRGDLEINETKLLNAAESLEIRLASDQELADLGLTKGSIAASLPEESKKYNIKTIADLSLKDTKNMCSGANAAHKHFTGVEHGRDWDADLFYDIHTAKSGMSCAHCKSGTLSEEKGMELGHIFKLGTKYSSQLKATFNSENNKPEDIIMGCYGIGVSRLMAAVAEAHNDENGLIWPMAVTPFQVQLIAICKTDECKEYAEKIYQDLQAKGITVLFDDRNDSPGAKFKDADLLGFPLRLVVSEKMMAEGLLELKERTATEATKGTEEEIINQLTQYIQDANA